jgi:hypothetical protein
MLKSGTIPGHNKEQYMSTISGVGGAGAAQAWTGASMRMPPQQKMSNLFDKIDSSGTGSITEAQFNQAFQSMNPPAAFKSQGADTVWSKLDPQGTGQVSKQDFVKGMTSMQQQFRAQHHHRHGAAQTTNGSTPQTLAQSQQSLNTITSSADQPSANVGQKIDTTA